MSLVDKLSSYIPVIYALNNISNKINYSVSSILFLKISWYAMLMDKALALQNGFNPHQAYISYTFVTR